MIRVLLADDHPAVRAGLRFLLDDAPDVEVVAEVADGAAAVEQSRALRPDVVLMDVRMPGTDGITATAVITAERLAEVLVLTTFDLDEYVTGALAAGAAGYLLKSAEPGVLLDAVRRVADGDGVLAPEVTRQVLRAFAASQGAGLAAVPGTSPAVAQVQSADSAAAAAAAAEASAGASASAAGVGDLTPREGEVLAALGRGLTNQQIATELYVSSATAKTHVSRVLMKLGVTSRVQAALVAQQQAHRPGPA